MRKIGKLFTNRGIFDKVYKERFADNFKKSRKNRLQKAICKYEEYCTKYETYMHTPLAESLVHHFDYLYPNSNISAIKKLDFMLWIDRVWGKLPCSDFYFCLCSVFCEKCYLRTNTNYTPLYQSQAFRKQCIVSFGSRGIGSPLKEKWWYSYVCTY